MSRSRSPSEIRKRRMDTLDRRTEFLKRRIQEHYGDSQRDRAELYAILWCQGIALQAIAEGIIDRLEPIINLKGIESDG